MTKTLIYECISFTQSSTTVFSQTSASGNFLVYVTDHETEIISITLLLEQEPLVLSPQILHNQA